jgi:hypothetical protein
MLSTGLTDDKASKSATIVGNGGPINGEEELFLGRFYCFISIWGFNCHIGIVLVGLVVISIYTVSRYVLACCPTVNYRASRVPNT